MSFSPPLPPPAGWRQLRAHRRPSTPILNHGGCASSRRLFFSNPSLWSPSHVGCSHAMLAQRASHLLLQPLSVRRPRGCVSRCFPWVTRGCAPSPGLFAPCSGIVYEGVVVTCARVHSSCSPAVWGRTGPRGQQERKHMAFFLFAGPPSQRPPQHHHHHHATFSTNHQ